MNPLYILTTANDKTRAAVTSLTDDTPVTSLEQMVLGDVPTLTIYFTDGDAAPDWSGAPGYLLSIGLGTLDATGCAAYTSSDVFTPVTGGWSGTLSLNTERLIDALALQVGSAVDWTRFPTQARVPFPRPQYGWFNLQIAVTDPSGYRTTYAELRVPMLNRVLPAGVATMAGAADAVYAYLRGAYLQNRSLVGIASPVADQTLLCGISTANVMSPGAKIFASFPSNLQAVFTLEGTTATSDGFLFAPWDYSATTNPVKWRLRAVYILGQPAIYNSDTELWHYLVAIGPADAVGVTCDQTGTALPA